MSFHLHVFNLREDATNRDIRQLFSDMAIQQDGVIIVGGPKGEAFVSFDSQLDLLRAMQRDGEQHLSFKVATDIDKLRGINRMCTANLQELEKADSVFIPGGYSKDTKYSKDVQTPKRQWETIGETGKHSKSGEPLDSDNIYLYDAKRRKSGNDIHIDSSSDMRCSDEYVDTNSHPKKENPPWLSLRHRMKPDDGVFPHTGPVHTPNQLQERPSILNNSKAMQFPYPPPVGPPEMPQLPVGPPVMSQSSVGPPVMPQSPVEPPVMPQSPVRPCNPYSPGFQDGASFNPVSPEPMPQQKSIHKASNIPMQGSLLMSLLPTSAQQRYCLQASDLPPDANPNMVWSWVGGPRGTACGVILLKPSDDYAVAFLIYNNQFDRDQRFKLSGRKVTKFNMADTCIFITNFIKNWTKWKGPRKQNSPIFESTYNGRERYVDHRTFYDFAKKSSILLAKVNEDPIAKNVNESSNLPCKSNEDPIDKNVKKSSILPNKPNEDPIARNVKKSSILPDKPHEVLIAKNVKKSSILRGKPKVDPFSKNIMPVPEDTKKRPRRGEPSSKIFLVLYKLKPTITATEVQSWFSDGLSALKLNFPEKDGPNDSEAMAFVLFANDEAYENAELGLTRKDLVSARCSFSGSYEMMQKYGDKCTITETTLFGGDRIISPEARKRQPFLVEAAKPQIVSAKSQALPEENVSFLYHLKTIGGPSDNTALFVVLPNIKKELTASQVQALVPDSLCALTVSFDRDSIRRMDDETIGYVLVENLECRRAVRQQLDDQFWKWWNTKKDYTPGIKLSKNFQAYKRKPLEHRLFRMCENATISQSSPSGVDRVLTMEELSIATIYPPFLIVRDLQYRHYVQLTGYIIQKYCSAGNVLDWLGRNNSEAKGVVLLIRKTDLTEYIACVAFSSLEACNKLADCNEQWFTHVWLSVTKMTEQQTLAYLSESSDDYIIKVSTEKGPDRKLYPAEQETLAIAKRIEPILKESSSMTARKPSDGKTTGKYLDDKYSGLPLNKPIAVQYSGKTTAELADRQQHYVRQSAGQAVGQSVEGKSTGHSKDITHGFYIRLKKVPTDVTTACELLSMYAGEEGLAKSATLVRDCDGVGESGYVMFVEVEHRDSALSMHPFAVRCTGHGRAIRLAELERDYDILESTEHGDRLMSAEERDGLQRFNQ